MAEVVEKLSDKIIKITKDLPAQVEARTYSVDQLALRRREIRNAIDSLQVELADVKDKLAKAKQVSVEPDPALVVADPDPVI